MRGGLIDGARPIRMENFSLTLFVYGHGTAVTGPRIWSQPTSETPFGASPRPPERAGQGPNPTVLRHGFGSRVQRALADLIPTESLRFADTPAATSRACAPAERSSRSPWRGRRRAFAG